MANQFKPNALTFEQGIQRLQAANKKSNYGFGDNITTSLDANARKATQELLITNVPGGFTKYQLPFFFDGPTQIFVSVGSPNVDVPEHSHDEGAGLRYIVAGSIIYNGQELKAGDWMFIPAGKKYSYKVGPQGVTAIGPYQCCCA